MNRFRLVLFVFILLAVLSGCQAEALQPDLKTIYTEAPYVLSLPKVNPQDYQGLFEYDDQAPLDIQESGRKIENGATWIELTYASPHGGRVPATLVLPPGKGPFAGVILMHGMPSNRQSLYGLAAIYVRYGAAALLIDAPFNRPENAQRTWVAGNPLDFSEQDRKDQIQLIVDLRRGIDLLSARAEVDPARLGYLGGSYGGSMGGLLAGVEKRLKAYVLVVGDGGLVDHVAGLDDLHNYPKGIFFRLPPEDQQAWVDLMWPIEPIHYVSQAAPAALLFQNGARDVSVPARDADRYQKAGSQPKITLWYDLGHDLMGDEQALRDQFKFLQEHIGAGTLVIKPAFSSDLMRLDQAMLAWSVLAVLSLGWVAWDCFKTRSSPRGARLLWIWTALLIGPVGLLAYLLVRRKPEAPLWRRAFASGAWQVSGVIAGMLVLLQLALSSLIPLPAGMLLYIAVPLVCGLALWNLAGLLSRKEAQYKECYRRSFLTELFCTSLGLAWLLPATSLAIERILPPQIGSLNLALSSTVSILGTGAILLTWPAQAWLIQRGLARWGQPSEAVRSRATRWLEGAALVVLSLACMAAALALVMWSVGLSPQELLQEIM